MTPEERDRLTRLETQMSTVREDMGEIKGDVKAIRAVVDEARGGWKVLAIVSGLSATVGGAIVKMAPQFFK
jgi:hypothetical protein